MFQAMKFAKGLLALGLKKGDNVCTFGCQGSDGVVMFVACSSLGITFCVSLYGFLDITPDPIMQVVGREVNHSLN